MIQRLHARCLSVTPDFLRNKIAEMKRMRPSAITKKQTKKPDSLFDKMMNEVVNTDISKFTEAELKQKFDNVKIEFKNNAEQ